MKNKYLFIFGIAVLLLFASPNAFACDCTSMLPISLNAGVNKAWKESDKIFTGIVESIADDQENRNRTIKLRLLKVWKGTTLSKEIQIVTG
jgi:hypothetical protein